MTSGKDDGDSSWGRKLRLPLMLGVPVVAAIIVAYLYLTSGRFVSTDDAYVKAAQVTISANVAGRVVELDVRDNQEVHKGDVLFRLDDRPYRIAVEEAEAQLADVRLQVDALKATYRQKLADLRSAQDTVNYQQREYDRQSRLLATGVSSQAQYDQAVHALQNARQQVAATEQQIANALANLGGNPDIQDERHPMVQQAQARVDRANLNLSYTLIPAPDDGIVANVEHLQVGDYLDAASPAFSLVSTRDVWVEANFKENDLELMRVGQTATLDFDTYPDKTFLGRVVSVSPATGSQFSVMPAENSTGNWVKVVQRLPVRLEIEGNDPTRPMRAGLSVTVSVDTKHRRQLLSLIESAFAGVPAGK